MIYICIPAHNEDRTIGVLLWKVRQVLANFPRDYQILVADDASTDATVEVLGPYERVLPLTVFRNAERKGYASSLEMLLREAVRRSEYPKRDVVVSLQADFTEDPESIVAMLKRIEAGADVVSGESPLPDDSFPRSYRWARRAARYLSGRRGLPEGVSDALTGLRVYRVLVLKKAFDARQGKRLITWEGWAANSELLLHVQPHSRRTEAMPIAFRPERLQRPRRFDFWGTLKQAWGLSRGRTGPLEHVALPQPGARDRSAGSGSGRGRHGTRGLETVSNGGGQRASGTGQRSRQNGRDTQEVRGREPREARPRRSREEQEQRPEAPRRRARSDQEPRQQEPTARNVRRGQTSAAQDSRQGQEPKEQAPRPRREGQQRTRRDPAERRERRQQQPEPVPQETVLQDSLPPESAEQTPAENAAETAPAPRKRRRRRRGSGASKNAPSVDAQSEMFDPTPGVLEESGPEDAGAGEDEGGSDGEPVKKRRRSRGRRGGRGRSRRSGAAESTGEGGDAPEGAGPADFQSGAASEGPAEPKSQQVRSVAEAPPMAPQMNEG